MAPLIITQALIDKLCANISEHNSIQTSYRMEGITDTQYSMVMVMAEADPNSMEAHLKASLDTAEAQAEAEAVKAVGLLAQDGHAGAIMWLMERRYASSWGKGDKAPKENAASAAAPQIVLPPNGRES